MKTNESMLSATLSNTYFHWLNSLKAMERIRISYTPLYLACYKFTFPTRALCMDRCWYRGILRNNLESRFSGQWQIGFTRGNIERFATF